MRNHAAYSTGSGSEVVSPQVESVLLHSARIVIAKKETMTGIKSVNKKNIFLQDLEYQHC